MPTIPADSSPDLPEDFAQRLREIVPAEHWDALLASLDPPTRVGLRINTLLTSVDAALSELNAAGIPYERAAWSTCAATITAEHKRLLTESPAVMEGRIYVQGLSSQLAPLALAPQPGELILDLAAAPGGKTLQLAALLQGQGTIAAVEPVPKRWFTLRENVRRAGAEGCVKLYQTDGREVGRKTPERFDAVLLDAPCTSEARFQRGDAASWRYWGPRKIAESARKQKALLRSALDATQVGGRVLYATCSFAPEENEAVLHHTLRRLKEAVTIEPLELPIANVQAGLTSWRGQTFDPRVAAAMRVLPAGAMTGFFLALVRKLQPTSRRQN